MYPHKSLLIPSLLVVSLFSACRTLRGDAAASAPIRTPTAPAAPVPAPAETIAEKSDEAAIASVLGDLKRKKLGYKISPADLIEITVYREDDLTRTLRVSQQGTIAFPLIGVLEVGGRNVIAAGALIQEKLKDFLVNPQVTVFIKEYGNKQIYVLGEVKSPGSYELPTETRLTVLEAISKAGGFSPVAAKDRTKVIRTAPDGRSINFTIEVSAITSRGEKDKDIPLEPNDVVYIPQSFF